MYLVYVGIRSIEPRRRVFLDVGLRLARGVYSQLPFDFFNHFIIPI